MEQNGPLVVSDYHVRPEASSAHAAHGDAHAGDFVSSEDVAHKLAEIPDFTNQGVSTRRIFPSAVAWFSWHILRIRFIGCGEGNDGVSTFVYALIHFISFIFSGFLYSMIFSALEPENSAVAVCKSIELYIPLGDLVNKEEELQKLDKRLSELDILISSIESKLSNNEFISKAPENIVEGEKNKLNDFLVERTKILSNIEVLK